jgi:general stress protein 26
MFAVLLATLPARATRGQEPKQFSRDELLSSARQIIDASRYCAFITLDSSGRARARTIDPFTPDEHFIVWIGTNPRTRKVAEIRRNPKVTLYYFDRESQGYVTLFGRARLVNNPNEKSRHFKPEWKDFYPDREKDFMLIEVKPERMEVIDVKRGVLGDPKTWKPLVVVFAK